MGRKGNETTEKEGRIVINLHNQCKSLGCIASVPERPKSAVQTIINRFCVPKSLLNKSRNGRPPLLSQLDKRFILCEIQ